MKKKVTKKIPSLRSEKGDWLKHAATVDIGIHTAIALWNGNSKPVFHTITIDNYLDIEDFLYQSWLKFSTFILHHSESFGFGYTFYLEGVEYWSGSTRSNTSAVKGDLFMLAYQLGVYTAILREHRLRVKILPASQWKGQLSKEKFNLRMKRYFDYELPNQHLRDALGMGLSLSQGWCKR